MTKRIKNISILKILSVFLLLHEINGYANSQPEPWKEWLNTQVQETKMPVVQNRQVSKAEHFQIVGPMVGISERRDFYNTYTLAFAGRYHFTEHHGWEILRLNFSFSNPTDLNTEIQEKTSFHPDVQLSPLQLSSSYVYSPIYGKYAWDSEHLIYFDIFGTIGGGIRFSETRQSFLEFGLGMNHYLFFQKLALIPEFRFRTYSEKRTNSTLVFESIIQLGVGWLF